MSLLAPLWDLSRVSLSTQVTALSFPGPSPLSIIVLMKPLGLMTKMMVVRMRYAVRPSGRAVRMLSTTGLHLEGRAQSLSDRQHAREGRVTQQAGHDMAACNTDMAAGLLSKRAGALT